jgi:hypothetical protein
LAVFLTAFLINHFKGIIMYLKELKEELEKLSLDADYYEVYINCGDYNLILIDSISKNDKQQIIVLNQ